MPEIGHTTEVRVEDKIWIKTGETVLVGRDPKDSPYADGKKRLYKIKGTNLQGLSRAALEISLSAQGDPHVIRRTANNQVEVHYQDKDDKRWWKTKPLPVNREPDIQLQRKMDKVFTIDIKTSDGTGTVVRLQYAGDAVRDSSGHGIVYRIEINPKQLDLNKA